MGDDANTFTALPSLETLDMLVATAGAPGNDARRADLERSLLDQLTRTDDLNVRIRTVRTLALAGSDVCVPPLAQLLAGEEPLRGYALGALWVLPAPAAGAALLAALENASGAAWRAAIANALGGRRERGAVAPLARMSEEGGIDGPEAALMALGHIGTAEAAEVLRAAKVAPRLQTVHARACLLCADQLCAAGADAALAGALCALARERTEDALLHDAAARLAARTGS